MTTKVVLWPRSPPPPPAPPLLQLGKEEESKGGLVGEVIPLVAAALNQKLKGSRDDAQTAIE